MFISEADVTEVTGVGDTSVSTFYTFHIFYTLCPVIQMHLCEVATYLKPFCLTPPITGIPKTVSQLVSECIDDGLQ